jgi:autotransporter-associated beta strand protein
VSNPGTDYSAQFSAAPSQQYRVNIIANQTVTFSSNLTSTGGTLTKSGVGTLVLAGANTFTGNTIVTAGNLGLSNALALQNSNLDTNASGSGNATRGLVLNPGVTSLTFGGLTGNKTLASLFNTTSGNYSSATNVTLNPGAGASYSYAAAIANGAPGMTLTKSGEGTQILTVANTHTGGTLLSGGTLNYGNATALSSGPLSFTANSTLQAGVATTLANAVNIATGVTGTLDTVGFATTLNGTLTGNGSLTKVGNGTLTIAGGGAGNTLAGSITVTAGTLGIDSINPAPTISSFANMNGAITIASGATLNFSQSFLTENLDNDITLNGSGTGGLGALNLWRNANATGTLTLASDASISHTFNTATISGPITGTNRNLTLTTLTANQPGMTVSGPIQLGTGGITVAGVANTGNFSIRLSGSNVYSGDTSVTSGTLMLSGAARLHDSSTVRISTGAILHLDFTGNETVGALVLNNAAQANGTYGSSTSAATNKSAFFLGDGVLQVGAAPANNYAAWAGIQQPPVTGAANGDDDNDGVQNLVEYALADGAERGSFNANTLTFTKRGAPFGSDLTYIIETSTTLAADSWVAAVTHGPAQLGSVISYELATSPSTPRIFARLRVVQNP